MKTAGVTLGVVGSFFALYFALITFNAEAILQYPGLMTELGGGEEIVTAVIALKWAFASVLFASLIFGIVGAAILNKRGAVSGILLISAAVLSAVTVCGIIAAICFALGGIFAFISDKQSAHDSESSEDDEYQEYDLGI